MVFVMRTVPGTAIARWSYDDGIDTARTRVIARELRRRLSTSRPARDGTGRYVQRLLSCPGEALAVLEGRTGGTGRLLDSSCNLK
jgi:hypothetical protein